MVLSSTEIVIAGIDESETALTAARWAAADAVHRGATLRLVHAFQDPNRGREPGAGRRVAAAIRADAARWLQLVADSVAAEHPGLAIETVMPTGRPAQVLRDQSSHSVATVVGATGQNRLAGAFLGTVTSTLTTHGHGTVVIARPQLAQSTATKPGAVVVGVDGSSHARTAVGFACEEAAFRGAPLVAIHIWDDKPLEHALGTYPLDINAQGVDDQELRLLEAELAGWEHKFPQVRVRLRVIRGRPTSTLLRYARSTGNRPAQLVVVGSRGRGGFPGLLLGSTSQALATHAECTVAIVHAGTDHC